MIIGLTQVSTYNHQDAERIQWKMNVLLNNYADIVYFTLKVNKLGAHNWKKLIGTENDNSATTQEHKDESNEFISAVYSLHTNDGGTKLKVSFIQV